MSRTAVNAWEVADRFKVPLVLSVVGALVSGSLVVAAAPPMLQLVVTAAASLAGFFTYWSALSGLQNALGPGKDD